VVKPGNWYVELDDGGGADRHTEIDGAAPLKAGDKLPATLHGRAWRIKRVDADKRYAVAIPDD
jgi:hypothetical protein